MSDIPPVLIIGAGVSGLCCALDLQARGVPVRVLEKSDSVGGRVRTDEVQGFRLDRGFQVWLEAYPECRKRLPQDVLQPGAFVSGAILYDGSVTRRFPDPFRHPSLFWEALIHPVGSLGDKLRMQKLRLSLAKQSVEEIFAYPEATTLQHWQDLGFSRSMIEGFFTPFFRGIFLAEPEEVSCRMFRFVFSMFGQGRALLPKFGIQAIPDFLASELDEGTVRFGCEVQRVNLDSVMLADGEELESSAVVVAVEDPVSLGLTLNQAPTQSRGVTCLYFDAATVPFEGGWLVLNGSGSGRVNQISVNSNVVEGLAPEGRHLIAVSLQGVAEEESMELVRLVTEELLQWFGPMVDGWRFLQEYRISHALPAFAPGQLPGPGVVEEEGIWICGDGCSHPSLQGAMASGGAAAEGVLKKLGL